LIEGLILGGPRWPGFAAGVVGCGCDPIVPLPGALPFNFRTGLDAGGLLFVLALGFLCVLLFGLAPAWQSARTDVQLALRARVRAWAGRASGAS